jgi:hypothetical protein
LSNKVAAIAIGAVLTGLIVGVVVASSGGGDDSKTTDVGAPELTVPGDSGTTERRSERKGTSGATGESGPAPDSGTGGESTGGAQAPPSNQNSGGAQAPPAPKDTPQNDVPPPRGSPAQKFEKFCQQNPGAC